MFHSVTITRKGTTSACRDGATGHNSNGDTAEVTFNSNGKYTRHQNKVKMAYDSETLEEAVRWMVGFLSGLEMDI